MPLFSFPRMAAAGAAVLVLAMPAAADRYGHDRYDGYDRGGGITLYDGSGFRGDAISIDGPLARLPVSWRFNDRAGSLSLRGGAWEVCEHANFKGRCRIVDYDVGDLRDIGMNNNISSVRPVGRDFGRRGGYDSRGYDRRGYDGYGRGGRGQADVILFDGAHFDGRSLPVNGAVARLGDYRGNDRASSILINRGTWLVCEHANFKGRCAVIDRSEPDLRPLRLNNNISSIKPYRGGRLGY